MREGYRTPRRSATRMTILELIVTRSDHAYSSFVVHPWAAFVPLTESGFSFGVSKSGRGLPEK